MASRRDELNAYTFAKKRLVSQFLQPNPSGTEEGAPRKLRAILPGLIIGVVILAAFGAWGMFKPKAPKGWDEPGAKVIVASESTTRYVVLKTDGKKQLHPVLNLASAKLLLDPNKFEIVEVDEATLDSGKIPRGATLGIPYAPDRLPDAKEASTPKRWAVCTQPGDGATVQKAAFVLADREKHKVDGKNRLHGGEVMYVQGPEDKLFIVDKKGTKYQIANNELLLRAVVGRGKPQPVTADWLRTLHNGDRIRFPDLSENIGAPANVPGNLDAKANRVGMVLKAQSGSGPQHYVVLKGQVRPINEFMADLLLSSEDSLTLGQRGQPRKVSPGAFTPEDKAYGAGKDWPTREATNVNGADSSRDTLCNVLRDVDKKDGSTKLSTWAGKSYPAQLPSVASSAYVTPGSGLLFRQFKGQDTGSGGVFLVTDTGLRYALQANSDGGKDSDIGSDGKKKDKKKQRQEGNKAAIRLGYKDAEPVPIPAAWSNFLPLGPRLSTSAAKQPQGA